MRGRSGLVHDGESCQFPFGSFQPPGRLPVPLLHIDQHDASARRVANDLDHARVLAAAVPAAVVLLLGELADRFAAELLESAADVAHVEKELLLGGDLGRRADAYAVDAVAEADPPEA